MRDLPINVFLQRPDPGLDRKLADLHGFHGIIIPAGRTWGKDNNKPRTFQFSGLFDLACQIKRFASYHCSHVGGTMGRPDGKQVFLVPAKAARAFAGCGSGAMGRRPGVLMSGIAVPLVIVADIDKIEATLDGGRGRRKPHAVSGTVPRKNNGLQIIFRTDSFLFKKDIQGIPHTLGSGRRRGHGGIEPGAPKRGEGIDRQQ